MDTPNKRFLELFKDLNLSIPEFAKECNMDAKVRTIYKIIKDNHKPSPAVIREVASTFPKFSVEYILYGDLKKVQNNVFLNASNKQKSTNLESKELNMINGFIKLETELVRTSNALQTTLLNCTNQIQEMVIQNAKTKNDFESHVMELTKQIGMLSASNLKLSNQILQVEAKVDTMSFITERAEAAAKEYIGVSQEAHARSLQFQQQIIPDIGELKSSRKKR